jgi:phosphoserine/homoserine phosphotransferase
VEVACLDLEGVLIPEIWIAFAEKTGIDELRATTRDIPDYDVLMRQRLALLDQHGLKLDDIQAVIAGLSPLPGARSFLDWLRERSGWRRPTRTRRAIRDSRTRSAGRTGCCRCRGR